MPTLIFIYFISRLQATCKNGNFECQYIRTLFEERNVKMSSITLDILHFCIKMLQVNCYPKNLESTLLDETIRYASRWFILT